MMVLKDGCRDHMGYSGVGYITPEGAKALVEAGMPESWLVEVVLQQVVRTALEC